MKYPPTFLLLLPVLLWCAPTASDNAATIAAKADRAIETVTSGLSIRPATVTSCALHRPAVCP